MRYKQKGQTLTCSLWSLYSSYLQDSQELKKWGKMGDCHVSLHPGLFSDTLSWPPWCLSASQLARLPVFDGWCSARLSLSLSLSLSLHLSLSLEYLLASIHHYMFYLSPPIQLVFILSSHLTLYTVIHTFMNLACTDTTCLVILHYIAFTDIAPVRKLKVRLLWP